MIALIGVDENMCAKAVIFWLMGGILFLIFLPVLAFQLAEYCRRRSTTKDLTGKVVLVTGASSGLGEAFAHEFYKEKCKLILASRNKMELERVRQAILKEHEDMQNVRGYPPVILPMDVSDVVDLPNKMDAALAVYGHIDILVNNAGLSYRGKILNTDTEVHQHLMMVNYFGQVALTRAVLPSMMNRRSGHILFVSSVQGLIGIPNRSAYVASKHALQGFSDCLRAEVAEDNIKVTVLSPGYIRTRLSMNALTSDGTVNGVMDEDIENGFEPATVAQLAVKAVKMDKKELVVAPTAPRLAIFIRYFFPGLFFRAMQARAQGEE